MSEEGTGPPLPGDSPAAQGSPAEAAPADSVPVSPPSAQPTSPIPGVRAVLGGGLDLNLSASRDLRRASLYIGLLLLALVAPFVLIILAYSFVQGSFDWVGHVIRGFGPALLPVDESVETYLRITGFIAIAGSLVIRFESQILATAILGGRALGRPLTLREAIRRSRQTFWRVVFATILVGITLAIPYLLLVRFVETSFRGSPDAQEVIVAAVLTLLSAPFAYIVTGVVLGDVGPVEAVRRSTRLARARWRLAIAVSIVGAAVTYLELFAIGAGIDILARVGTALHLGVDSAGATIALAVMVLAGVLAIGSLNFQLAALRDAPQVVSFLGLTGYGAGLDRARVSEAGEASGRWISLPMAIVIGVGLLAGTAGVLTLVLA